MENSKNYEYDILVFCEEHSKNKPMFLSMDNKE